MKVEDDVHEGEVGQGEELEAAVVPVQDRPVGRPPRRPRVPAPERLPGPGRAAREAPCRRPWRRRRLR